MTCTRESYKFNFDPCSVIPILFAGNILNMFALQTPHPVEQLEDTESENRKAQLGRWIKTGLIRGSAKDRHMPCLCVCVYIYRFFFPQKSIKQEMVIKENVGSIRDLEI